MLKEKRRLKRMKARENVGSDMDKEKEKLRGREEWGGQEGERGEMERGRREGEERKRRENRRGGGDRGKSKEEKLSGQNKGICVYP